MDKKILKRIPAIIIIVVLFFCTIGVSAQENDKVVLQLRWNHQFQFAGYYVAQWKGFYQAEGLDVEIRSAFTPQKNILNATEEVISGRADFGIGAVDILMAENQGADLSVIASMFQRSAVEFYMKSETPFRSIVDLTRLNTARREHDLLDIELQAMLISEGIRPDNSKMIPYNYDFTADDLASGKFDVIPGYLGTIPYLAQKQGLSIKAIKPIDYGIDFYGDSLFTKRSFALAHPELVEKFRRASIKGWEYAIEHQDEVAKRIAAEFPIEGKSETELHTYNRFQARRVSGLTLYPVVEIGNINPYRWMKMQEVLLKLGLVSGHPDFERFIFDYDKIVSDRAKRIERAAIIAMLVFFSLSAVYFVIRLAASNNMLRKENFERKKAEEKIQRSTQRYHAMYSSAVIGITITSPAGILLQANRRWLEMTGYDEKDVIGRPIESFIIPGDEKTQKLRARFAQGEIESYEIEQQYARKDGGICVGRLFMTSIFDQDTDEKVNMGMVVDITNEKNEEALLIYQARLAAMGEMIGNIAHQWRQPLNNLGLIITNLEDASLHDELEQAQVRLSVEKCRKLIGRMSETIDDFRYFLNPKNEKTHFSVADNIRTVLEMLEENLRFNKITVDMDEKTDAEAFGYANQYSQAIFNIINNSLDALADMNIQDKHIGICVYEENGMIHAEISDNGTGIPAESVDKIFDVYYSTKNHKKGTGLGLYMTRLIIENNMKGRVELLTYQKGVKMRVSIPVNGGER